MINRTRVLLRHPQRFLCGASAFRFVLNEAHRVATRKKHCKRFNEELTEDPSRPEPFLLLLLLLILLFLLLRSLKPMILALALDPSN